MLRNPLLRRFAMVRLAVRLFLIYRRICRLQASTAHADKVDQACKDAGRSIRETGYAMRGIMVKVGQFLSLRQDLFSASFTKELQGLQDEVPPEPFHRVKVRLERDLGRPMSEVFAQFDENPIASGSIAQGHRAVLATGEEVAVKVLRPDIERLVAIDLSTLRVIVRVLARLPRIGKQMDFRTLHQVFTDTIGRELDMTGEAQQMQRFAQDFRADERIVVPKVYMGWVTQRVLVMEYVVGTNIRDLANANQPSFDLAHIRDTLLDAYVQQILVNGFIHLDPHPGNLAVLHDGRVAFLDFGMVADLDQTERTLLRQLIQFVLFRNIEGVIEVLLQLGYLEPGVNRTEFAYVLKQLAETMNVEHLRSLLSQKGFRLQAKYMLLIRCLGLLKTVLTELSRGDVKWMEILPAHIATVLLAP